jgi:hypothetical protein
MLHAAPEAEGREIMMHPHSPSPPQLAIPGIGYPQNFSVGPDVLDPAAFRDWSDKQFDAPMQPIDRIAWRPSPRQWRRNLLAAGGTVLATGVSGLLLPARAQGIAPTPSMSGGSNNYRKGAATVDRIGKGGFWMSGTVRRAGDGAPLAGQRIQIWAHTTEGQEHEPQSHGATLTDKNGAFRLEMPQIIPIFGQPHGHLAYDSGEFKTVFLRPVMRSAKDTSLEAHFVLQPV